MMPIIKKNKNTKRTIATNRAPTIRKAAPEKALVKTITVWKQAIQKDNLKDPIGTPYIDLLMLPFK